MGNNEIASRLKDCARHLEERGGNLYRIKAYRRAAAAIASLSEPVEEVVRRDGADGLRRLPDVGGHLAFAIEQLIRTGKSHQLDLETHEVRPEDHVRSLPGVGPRLAEKLWQEFGIQSVQQLNQAIAEHGLDTPRLSKQQRRRLIESTEQRSKEERLTRGRVRQHEPPVDVLLEVDRWFRQHNEPLGLPPSRIRYPQLCRRCEGWSFRVKYVESSLAHRLGKANDWVEIHFTGKGVLGQRIIFTEEQGDLAGTRLVRGREEECREHYRSAGKSASPISRLSK